MTPQQIDAIPYRNGSLFADADVIELRPDEIRVLTEVSRFGWEHVEPSKRSQIGAHYTSRQDTTDLVEPVLMAPLRREWSAVQAGCEDLAAEASAARTPKTKADKLRRRDRSLQDFIERLAHVTVLDPACGSGNFLYVALHLVLDLEKEVITYASRCGLSLLPQVRPTQLAGIEINPYAQELAQVVVWIGFLQWKHHNGFTTPRNPVLEPVEPIRRMDVVGRLRSRLAASRTIVNHYAEPSQTAKTRIELARRRLWKLQNDGLTIRVSGLRFSIRF